MWVQHTVGFCFFSRCRVNSKCPKTVSIWYFQSFKLQQKESISKLTVNSCEFTWIHHLPTGNVWLQKSSPCSFKVPVWQVPGLVDTAIQVRVGMGFSIGIFASCIGFLSLDTANSWKTRVSLWDYFLISFLGHVCWYSNKNSFKTYWFLQK